jgi:hypothetical protein
VKTVPGDQLDTRKIYQKTIIIDASNNVIPLMKDGATRQAIAVLSAIIALGCPLTSLRISLR